MIKSPTRLLSLTGALLAASAVPTPAADPTTPKMLDPKTPNLNIGDEAPPEAPPTPKVSAPVYDKASPEMAWWREADATREQRLAWWREARFGMFIHWGVYSEPGGEWQGKPIGGYTEHIQRKMKIPAAVYRREVIEKFNPTLFNADAWVAAAKNAGMRYMIITAKHHDGFAMYDSKVSAYNVVQATPWRRDPMRELRAACTRQGIKFGFYYSHAFDWGEANAPGNDWEYNNPGGDLGLHGGGDWWKQSPEFIPKFRQYVDQKAIPQIVELIKNYQPDILWFDTPHKLPPEENLRILRAMREAGPNVVVNSRIMQNVRSVTLADYKSTADRPAEFQATEGDWEGVPTTNESYGYSKSDNSHKSPAHFIQMLAKASARGGNTLLNVGPRGDGTIDPKDLSILQGIGDWMKTNAPSIRGTQRTPLPVQAWGESTVNGNTLYLHVFDWPRDGRLVVGGLKNRVQRAISLSSPQVTLATERLNSNDLLIRVPLKAPHAVNSVVALTLEGNIATDPRRLISPTVTANTLRVFDGERRGSKLRFGAGKTQDAWVYGWSDVKDTVVWPTRLNQAATFEVSASYDADASSAGSTYAVKIGDQTLTGTVQEGKMVTTKLGRVQLQPGSFDLTVQALEIKGSEMMKLRAVTLTPVKK